MRRVGILSLVGIALGLPSVAWGAAPAHAALPGAAASGAPTPNGPGEGEQLVVIGTTGLTWHDAVNGRLAATAELLRSRRAALANVASGAGQSDTCGVETWRELAPLVSAVLADARPAATTAPIALGPGAIIASETAGVDAGAVPGLTPAGYPDEVRRGLAAGARLVLVDAGSDGNLPLAQVDQRIADIASAAPRARVLVVSLCHPTQRQFGLGAYIDPVSPDPAGATSSWSTLTSPATRHRGLVTLADLADLATRAPASAGPSRITEDPAPARAPWAAPLADDSLHALAGAAIVGWAYLVVIPAGIACLIPVARFARTGRRAHEAALTRTCLAIAAAGAGSYVANLFPWWR
ncbi:MAG: hypothetical protein LBK72_01210, partial [Bifidobacteriaceae bacterium]|nr:hypothetical protein [Bifidobacteriaceae bacterium]